MGVHHGVAQCDGRKRKTMKERAKEITVNIIGNEERKREQELQWIYWEQMEVVRQVLLLVFIFYFLLFYLFIIIFFFFVKEKVKKEKVEVVGWCLVLGQGVLG